MTEIDSFEGWAVLELMGHRRLGGYVREQTVAGAAFLRIDVPGDDAAMVATQLYAPSAVYCLTPTTEEMARTVAKCNQPEPVHRWELPVPKLCRTPSAYDVDGDPFINPYDDDEEQP